MSGGLICAGCGSDNRDGASFCGSCGAQLARECASCGTDMPAGLKFCDRCGAPIERAASAFELAAPAGDRKVVTIVFADLSGSTQMQERLDAEATARVMERVQRALSTAVEDNGGRVVKSTGDGLMAVFGVPVVREDDAVRAVRAGLDMQAAFTSLDLEDVALRVGVNTGEVVVSPDSDDVVGDPVNVAARLEAAAGLGEVYVGPETYRLVRDVIAVEPVAPLRLKGKAEPVSAARVVDAAPSSSSTNTAFVGREDEIDKLIAVLDDAVDAHAGRLATVVAWPGLGKSRLAAELADRVSERTTIIEVRFVADTGSSFGPIADAVRGAVDIATIDLGADHERVLSTIDALHGGSPAGSAEQIFWAVRRVLEGLAASRPVVVVLDDLHWAEPAMLDLVEHLVEWVREAPVLLLALARPELREVRPAFVDITGPAATVVVLDGLAENASRRLALEILDTDELPDAVLARVLDVSEGNPLFLRELLRLLVDDGVLVRAASSWALTVEVDAIEMPATIHATMAARIEQLSSDERSVLQAASVIGRHFPRGAVAALLPAPVAVRLDEHLASLHRRALIDPEGTWWQDERMYRFHHVLIRDAAYRRVLKEVRADHHIRYADWLTARAAGESEHDEVLAFHLEQALRYHRELAEPEDAAIVDRAVRHLAAAGRRALDIDDLANAASLLGRALELAPADVDLLRDRCEALVSSGNVRDAAVVVDALASSAVDDRSRAWSDVFGAQLAGQGNPDALREVADRATAAAAVFAAAGDDVGVAKAESVAATALGRIGQVAACEAALDRSLAAARRAGNTRLANVVLSIAPTAALWGPSPIARASGRCLDVVRVLRITTWAPHVEAHALRCQAVLEAMRDRADAARRMLDSARATFTDLGHRWGVLEATTDAGLVELLAGDPAEAEQHLRQAVDGFHGLGARTRGAQAVALLARALLELGRVDEAAELADPSLAGDDLKASIGLLCVAAEVSARRGDVAEALALSRRAVALAEPTDALVDHADARLALAIVLGIAGRAADASAERARARDLYETKGATVGMRRAGAHERTMASADQSMGRPHMRRLQRNVAIDAVERWQTAWEARDWQAVDALYADGWSVGSNRLDSVEEPGGPDPLTRASMRVPGVAVRVEVLAALGQRHCLLRRTWLHPANDDRGAFEMDNASVARVDGDGRFTRIDSFDATRVADAAACLVERWAEEELEGGDRIRAMQMAEGQRSTHAVNARDWERYADAFTEDSVLADHRGNGFEVRGREGVVDWIRQLVSAGADVQVHVTDVLALTPQGGVWRSETRGGSGGGEFSVPTLIVFHVAADGRFDHREFFRPDQIDEAWACFDRLVGTSPRRRVRTNRATDTARRMAVAIHAGDLATIDHLMVESSPHEHSSLHADVPGTDAAGALRYIARARGSMGVDTLATAGDCHALDRVSFVFTDREHGGVVEVVQLNVTAVDGDGRVVRQVQFDDGDLAPALARLTEWSADELDGPGVRRALRSAQWWAFGRLVADRDWTGYRALFTDDAVQVDHRPGGAGAVVGGDAITEWISELAAAAKVVRPTVVEVLALTPDAALWRNVVVGQTVDGGALEIASYAVLRFAADGRVDRADLFPLDRVDDAWACFDTYAGGVTREQRRVAANRATDTVERWFTAYRARDRSAGDALLSPSWTATDHHYGFAPAHFITDRALDPAWGDGVTCDQQTLAALGERHCLIRRVWTVAPVDDRGAVAYEFLTVVRVDADDRMDHFDSLDADELAMAVACLYERWAEDELMGDERERGRRAAAVWAFADAANTRDWDRYRSLYSDVEEVVHVDHRPTGVGKIRGRDEATAWLRELAASVDDMRIEVTDVLALTPHAALWHNLVTGTRDGGPYAIPSFIALRFGVDGGTARVEFFTDDQLADAWACFEQLDAAQPTAGTPGRSPRTRREIRANAALRLVERWASLFNRRDLDAANALRASGYKRADHRWHHHVDREAAVALDVVTSVDGRAEIEALATMGDRHVLNRLRFLVGDAVSDLFLVTAVTTDGAQIIRDELFDAAGLNAALAALVEGWAEAELDSAARDRAPAIAASFELTSRAVDRNWAACGELFSEDAVLADHRGFAGDVVGRAAIVRWLEELLAPAESLRSGITDVFALTPDVAVVQIHTEGMIDGGGFQMSPLCVMWYGGDGTIIRVDIFAAGDLDAAFGVIDGRDPPRPLERRVLANRASMVVARWASAVNAGDAEGARDGYSPGYVMVRHDQHLCEDRDTWLATERGLIGSAAVAVEPLATLGARHALSRVGFDWEGEATGHVRTQFLFVARIDVDDRVEREDMFADGALADALACLIERWAEDELDDDAVATERALAIAEACHMPEAAMARDWVSFERMHHPKCIVVDHRPNSIGVLRGRTEIVRWTRWIYDLSDTVAPDLRDVVALAERAGLVRVRVLGQLDGAHHEWESLQLLRFGDDGRITSMEYFGLDQIDEAWQRFDTVEPAPRSGVRPNLAWAAVERWGRLARAGDIGAVRDLYAASYDQRRHDHHVDVRRDEHTSGEAHYVARGVEAVADHVLTLGDRVDLHRLALRWDDDGAGQIVAEEYLVVSVVGLDGRFLSDDVLPAGDLARALAVAVERWVTAEVDGAPPAIAVTRFLDLCTLVNEERWNEIRAMYLGDATHTDHRSVSIGTLAGADAIVEWMSSFGADRLHIELADVVAFEEHGWLVVQHATGHQHGAPFELDSIVGVCLTADGRVRASAQFAVEDVDAAMRWLDRGRSPTLDVDDAGSVGLAVFDAEDL